MELGEPDPLSEALRASERAERTVDAERKQKKAARREKKSRKEDDEATEAAGKRVRAQTRYKKPIGSFFELMLILLILMGVGAAAVVWQQFFADDEDVVASARLDDAHENLQNEVTTTTPTVSTTADISGTYTLSATVTAAGEGCTSTSFPLEVDDDAFTLRLPGGNVDGTVDAQNRFSFGSGQDRVEGTFKAPSSGPVTVTGSMSVSFEFETTSVCTWSLAGPCTAGPCLGKDD